MRRFLKSPMNRAFLLVMVGNVVFGIWIRPDAKRAAAAARAEGAHGWAVALLIVSLALLALVAVEVYLIYIACKPPQRER